jgi:hypothetical protein
VDFVFPILCAVSAILMVIAALIRKQKLRDYLNYLMIDLLFGLIPLILLILEIPRFPYPSFVSLGVSVFSLTAILVFQWDLFREELHKRLHV